MAEEVDAAGHEQISGFHALCLTLALPLVPSCKTLEQQMELMVPLASQYKGKSQPFKSGSSLNAIQLSRLPGMPSLLIDLRSRLYLSTLENNWTTVMRATVQSSSHLGWASRAC
jgi:hypothetical protein